MQTVGSVLRLFIVTNEEKKPHEKPSLLLDKKGILEDKHYNTLPERTILITSIESYQLVKERLDVTMPYGYLGENILIDYNPYHLPVGTPLQIGTVTLEITQNCTLCNHLSLLDRRIPKLLKEDRGVFAKVINGGTIHRGDTITLIP